jgi:hypothetical protein
MRLAGDIGEAGLTGGKLMAIISLPVEFTPNQPIGNDDRA